MPNELALDARASLVQVRIGNKVVDARKVPNCSTCMHPARMEIEEMIIHGYPYGAIAKQYSEVEFLVQGEPQVLPKVDWQSIRGHYLNDHMPIDGKVIRHLIEKRAEEVGAPYEEIGERFVDQVLVARMVLAKGQQRLADGTLQPDVKDTLAAAKFLQDVENASKGAEDTEVWGKAMEIYFQTARRYMPDEMWTQFTADLSANPILQQIARKVSGNEDPNVLDAEFTEEPA